MMRAINEFHTENQVDTLIHCIMSKRFEFQEYSPTSTEVYIMHTKQWPGMCTECESKRGIWCDYMIEIYTGVGYATSMFNMHMCKSCAYKCINRELDWLPAYNSKSRAEKVREFYKQLNQWIKTYWTDVFENMFETSS